MYNQLDLYLNELLDLYNQVKDSIMPYISIYMVCFGISFGLMILLLTQLFIELESKIPLFFIPFTTSLVFILIPSDVRRMQDYLDIPILIISLYLFVRCCMLISRSISHTYEYDNQTAKPQILIISFISLTFAFYLLYNTYERSNDFLLVYGLNIISIIITLISSYGFISDLSLSILYSIVAVSRSNELADIISIMRLCLLGLTFLSPLFNLSASDREDLFLPCKLEESETKYMLIIMLITYFISSPGYLWDHGNVSCFFLGLATPIMYSLLLLYETYLDPN